MNVFVINSFDITKLEINKLRSEIIEHRRTFPTWRWKICEKYENKR